MTPRRALVVLALVALGVGLLVTGGPSGDSPNQSRQGSAPSVESTDTGEPVDARDANASVDRTVELSASTAVTYRGPDPQRTEIRVENDGRVEGSIARGPVLRVLTQPHFDHAQVRVPIHDDVPEAAVEHLSVYVWYDLNDSTAYQRVPTRIRNRTAIAEIQAPGYVTVLDTREWERYTTYRPGPGADLQTDTDNDGLADAIEQQRWVMTRGVYLRTFSTDPRDHDTDGEGLSDGEEYQVRREVVDGETVYVHGVDAIPGNHSTDSD